MYEIGETLGTGHFSKVKLGIHKETGMKVAIKVSRQRAGCRADVRGWRCGRVSGARTRRDGGPASGAAPRPGRWPPAGQI